MSEARGTRSPNRTRTVGRFSDARVQKRSSKPIACQKCHVRKVRCSGGQPCSNCLQADCTDQCVYPPRDRQVKVSQKYIEDLLEENQRLRHESRNSPTVTTELGGGELAQSTGAEVEGETAEAIRNPLLEDRPWFVSYHVHGLPIHIGEIADAAFATRFRQAISGSSLSHIPRTAYADDVKLATLSTSECQWPSPPRARFLVKACLNTICSCYHIVRKSLVLNGLEAVISDPVACDRIFMCKLWAIFALGDVYSTRSSTSGGEFPGLAYYSQASKILIGLSERPRLGEIEVLILLSIYALAINRRHAAYSLAGSALRYATVMGLNLNVPDSFLTNSVTREHRIRVWWTAYTCDRMFASKVGLSISMTDDDIEVDLPRTLPGDPSTTDAGDFGDPEYQIALIKLARLSSQSATSLYGRRRQEGNFSQRVQRALKDLQRCFEELPEHLRIDVEQPRKATVDSVISLHLSFNQCLIVATRPVLLHVLGIYHESWMQPHTDNHVSHIATPNVATVSSDSGIATTPSIPPLSSQSSIPETASVLAEACIKCARHSCHLLTESWINGSFKAFDYFSTQYLFSAATVLAVSSLLNGKQWQADRNGFETAAQFLAELKANGSFAATEYCQHIDAMRLAMKDIIGRRESGNTQTAIASASDPGMLPHTASTQIPRTTSMQNAGPTQYTAGMALAEPSLQEFLADPGFDLRFNGREVYDTNSGFQNLYWPDVTGGVWMNV